MGAGLTFVGSAFVPSWSSVTILLAYLGYLAIAGSVLPGKLVAGAVLSDGSRIIYRCNGLLSLSLLVVLLGLGVGLNFISLSVIADSGPALLSTTLVFSILVSLILHVVGCKSRHKGSSLRPHVTGNFIHDWWFGIQLNPHVLGVDLKFFFVRAGMMGWLLLNLSILLKSSQTRSLNLAMMLYQLFCALYTIDYFVYEEYMTSTWDIIAERLGFMLVFGDLVWIPFTFSIQGWWLSENKVEMNKWEALANGLVFVVGYCIFRGANKQKHDFKKNPTAPIWGAPPKVIGGKLLASGYWGVSRHCNYLGDLLLALSFSLPCGAISIIPYFYPIYLFVLLVWRERRDEARCSQKYKETWAEYCRLVPWRIFPYVY
ncbi:delta(14)-sterol reductase-like isoform X2 [Wolffia australiana]